MINEWKLTLFFHLAQDRGKEVLRRRLRDIYDWCWRQKGRGRHDVLFPRKLWNIYQPSLGECYTVPGGISEEWGMIPAILDIVDDIKKKICPSAYFFNYSNQWL